MSVSHPPSGDSPAAGDETWLEWGLAGLAAHNGRLLSVLFLAACWHFTEAG